MHIQDSYLITQGVKCIIIIYLIYYAAHNYAGFEKKYRVLFQKVRIPTEFSIHTFTFAHLLYAVL